MVQFVGIFELSQNIFTRGRITLVCYTAVFSLVTQRSSPHAVWGGALRDETKKGCLAD